MGHIYLRCTHDMTGEICGVRGHVTTNNLQSLGSLLMDSRTDSGGVCLSRASGIPELTTENGDREPAHGPNLSSVWSGNLTVIITWDISSSKV